MGSFFEFQNNVKARGIRFIASLHRLSRNTNGRRAQLDHWMKELNLHNLSSNTKQLLGLKLLLLKWKCRTILLINKFLLKSF